MLLKESKWRTSILCRIMAVTSMLSSEMSLCTFMAMSLFQSVTLRQLPQQVMETQKTFTVLHLIIWFMMTIISVLPVVGLTYFEGLDFVEPGSCLIYNFASGQTSRIEYNLGFSVALNVGILCVLSASYISIIYRKASSEKKLATLGKANRSQNRRAYILLRILMFSNVLCWLPMLGLLVYSFFGGVVLPEISSWFAVFILPLNSLTNSFLYTLRNIKMPVMKSN